MKTHPVTNNSQTEKQALLKLAAKRLSKGRNLPDWLTSSAAWNNVTVSDIRQASKARNAKTA